MVAFALADVNQNQVAFNGVRSLARILRNSTKVQDKKSGNKDGTAQHALLNVAFVRCLELWCKCVEGDKQLTVRETF